MITSIREEQIILPLTCVLMVHFLVSMIIPAHQGGLLNYHTVLRTRHHEASKLTSILFLFKKKSTTLSEYMHFVFNVLKNLI